MTETQAFNDRLQPCRMNVNSSSTYYSHCAGSAPSGTVIDFTMGYNAGSTDNGNIVSWSATGQQTFTRSYGYNNVNAIQSMTDTASGQACKGLSWTVDAWGNMVDQTPTSGSCIPLSTSASTNNQLAGYQYDAAGNVLYDGVHHYTYDAEGRVLTVDSGSTASYVYNENGQRVRKNLSSGWMEYFYDFDGNVQVDFNGSFPNQYVYDGSKLVAIYTNGTTEFIHPDHLGSTRLVTGVNQALLGNVDYYPYGQSNSSSPTNHEFTGKERDAESGNDYFVARYYASSMGRWMSPDPSGLVFAESTNPQTLNLYSYVENSPLIFVDPSGLWLHVSCYNDPDTTTTTTDANGNSTTTVAGGAQHCTYWDDGTGEFRGLIPSKSRANFPPPARNFDANNAPKKNLFLCASDAASKVSFAADLHAIPFLKSGVGGFIADAVGGNEFSGATDLIHSIATGEGGGHSVFYNMGQGVVAGPTQGFGAAFEPAIEGTPFAADLVGAGTTALVGAEYATGIGEVKLGIDFTQWAGSVFGCAAGIIH